MTSYLPSNMQQHRESEFLELRQRLKDSIRQKKKMQNGSDIAPPTSEQRKTKLMYNDFGSFFGPSQPVIALRVLQERQSIAAKLLNSIQIEKSLETKNANEVTSTQSSKKRKAEKLKESRDYSFLFSDNAELPVSRTEPSTQNVPIPNESHSKPVSSGSQMCSRNGSLPQRPDSVPADHKRPKSRPSSKEIHSKPVSSGSQTGLSTKGQAHTKPLTCVPKEQRVEQRKVSQEELKRSRMVPRQSLQRAQQLTKKTKIVKMSKDGGKALQIIRKMFNTDRYAGRDFDDDENMEANFDDILKEEKRSEKLGKKEDAEQLKLIAEELRRERLRKEKKKQKLNH